MPDLIAWGKANKAIKSSISGWKSITLDEQTGQVTAINNAGQTFHWNYPIPKDGEDGSDGVSVVNIYKDETNMIYAEFSDGQTVRVGYAPEGPPGPPGPVNMDSQMSDVSENPVQNKTIKEYVDIEVDKIKMAKFPNVTFIGQPQINGGQVRGFSSNDYARFPFLVDLTNKPFEINFNILTGSNVASQENIFDSDFGLAFAIRNSRLVIAMSSNGYTWDIGETIGTRVILPNTQFKIRISWDLQNYKVEVSTNGGESYVTDIIKASTLSLYPTQIYIGVGESHGQVQNNFSGMIDFTDANLIVDGIVRWVGLDVVGIDTRLAKDVSNIDEAGIAKIKEITGTSEVELTQEHLTGELFNNKPVYEKLFELYAGNSINSEKTLLLTTDFNISKILSIDGVSISVNGNTIGIGKSTPQYNLKVWRNSINEIREIHDNVDFNSAEIHLILKYIKN